MIKLIVTLSDHVIIYGLKLISNIGIGGIDISSIISPTTSECRTLRTVSDINLGTSGVINK